MRSWRWSTKLRLVDKALRITCKRHRHDCGVICMTSKSPSCLELTVALLKQSERQDINSHYLTAKLECCFENLTVLIHWSRLIDLLNKNEIKIDDNGTVYYSLLFFLLANVFYFIYVKTWHSLRQHTGCQLRQLNENPGVWFEISFNRVFLALLMSNTCIQRFLFQ